MTSHGLAVLLVGVVQLVVLAGCNKTQPDDTPEPDANTVTASWGWIRSAVTHPGISSATIDYGTWENNLVFAVWLDRDPVANHVISKVGTKLPATKSEAGKWEEKYWISFASAPEVKAECVTTDGRSGTVTVNGKSFDLREGNLILVSTAGGIVRHKQLRRDGMVTKPAQNENPPACFAKLKNDPEVTSFFANGSEPQEAVAQLPTYFLSIELPRIENSKKNWNDATRILRELPCAAKPTIDPKTNSWINANWNQIAQGPMNVQFPFAPTSDSDLGDIAKAMAKLGGEKSKPVVMISLALATPIDEEKFAKLKAELASAKGIDWGRSTRSRLALNEAGGAKFEQIRAAYKKAGITLSDAYADK